MTEYLVLRKVNGAWREEKKVEAGSENQAKRAVAVDLCNRTDGQGENALVLVAVPTRSWKVTTVERITKPQLLFSDGEANGALVPEVPAELSAADGA